MSDHGHISTQCVGVRAKTATAFMR